MNYCKVLIIDDELITRQGIKHMILWEKEGFQIIGEASNGQEGLELVDKLKPDIVLADIVMPVLNGIDFSFIIRERHPNIQLIMLSSYDDFEYVKPTLLNGAVDYVLKPTLSPEILLSTLNKAVRRIPGMCLNKQAGVSLQQQIERYLTGYQESIDMSLVRESFPYMHYRLLCIDLKSTCDNNRHLSERIKEWLYIAMGEDSSYKKMSVLIGEEILCYIFNYLKKDEETLEKKIQSIADKVAKVAEKAFFVLSKPLSSFEALMKCYEDTMCPALKQRFYYPGSYLLTVEENMAEAPIERFEFETFTDHLNNERFDKALELLMSYTHYLCAHKYDEYLTKNLVKNLLYNFIMSVESCDMSSEMLKDGYFKKIDSAYDVNVFMAYCEEIFAAFNKIIEETGEDNDHRIRAIKDYIWEHSGEKLDLTEIAAVFGFNYHYISSYFNQHISEGFSGYLNKIRIEKACAMLKNKKIPISAISGEVGYSDHGYFCRVFKKVTGKTPSQYRRSTRV